MEGHLSVFMPFSSLTLACILLCYQGNVHTVNIFPARVYLSLSVTPPGTGLWVDRRFIQKSSELSMAAYAYEPSTEKAEAGELL